jgi:hypothetical protein
MRQISIAVIGQANYRQMLSRCPIDKGPVDEAQKHPRTGDCENLRTRWALQQAADTFAIVRVFSVAWRPYLKSKNQAAV